ncbi:DUF1659 domain-containing protein [Oceanirhabdus sp. W0125-5]|uniref:DUF1659 domain-containing protein n=1 Tax=Oceanirhabdus sp. W0125-5 TaxID=2999116 RepID=UPI0022F2A9E8|nr:DUF1659 domain-containing protein [Oceanirhabdus sp. W0125-5]WBW96372.1 DUF1659 domain-containing protein [Oceanirhabdus sp. W0125-5]
MAVTKTRVDSDLIVGVKTGTKASGGDEIKNFRFSKIKIDAFDEAIYAVGAKIAAVLPYPTKYIQRVNDNLLISE